MLPWAGTEISKPFSGKTRSVEPFSPGHLQPIADDVFIVIGTSTGQHPLHQHGIVQLRAAPPLRSAAESLLSNGSRASAWGTVRGKPSSTIHRRSGLSFGFRQWPEPGRRSPARHGSSRLRLPCRGRSSDFTSAADRRWRDASCRCLHRVGQPGCLYRRQGAEEEKAGFHGRLRWS